MIAKILFMGLIIGFFSTAYFIGFIWWFNEITAWFNSTLWINIPFELRIVILWFVIAIIIAIFGWIVYG